MDLNKDWTDPGLVDQCREAGGLTFARFMHEALWGHEGYYASKARIGMQGSDFYTSATVPLFGLTLARYVEGMWRNMGSPDDVCLVEIGPGEGSLLSNLLPEVLKLIPAPVHVHAVLVEPSDSLTARQKRAMDSMANSLPGADWDRVSMTWMKDLVYVGKRVVVLANEVLDALPVERMKRSKQGWQQAFVVADQERLRLTWRAAQEHLAALAERWLPIPEETQGELCPELDKFFERLSTVGDDVHAVFFDYGITRAEWESGIRPEGTVRSFLQHRIVDVLDTAGQADITADVHWDYAMDCAQRHGFRALPLCAQSAFLLRWGIHEVLQANRMDSTMDIETRSDLMMLTPTDSDQQRRWVSQFKQLVLPGGMGERFDVLECVKG